MFHRGLEIATRVQITHWVERGNQKDYEGDQA